MLTKFILFFIFSSLAFATTDLSKVNFILIDRDNAATFLSTSDEYTANLSTLDLSLYHSTKQTILMSEHLEFLKTTSLDWNDIERKSLQEKISTFIKVVNLMDLKLNLPEEILLIKTNGQDAFNSHYTRKNAIIFPANEVGMITTDLSTFYHEMFHIFSRYNRALTDDLYAICNFRPIKRLTFNSDFEKIRTTNPDAFYYEHAVSVTVNNQSYNVVPVMYSAILQDQIDGPVDESKIYKLGLFENSSFNNENRIMFKTSETNYKEMVMANTHYYIHPEEIMAENFKLLLLQNTEGETIPPIKYQQPLNDLKKLLQN